jgi:hypothetical protein
MRSSHTPDQRSPALKHSHLTACLALISPPSPSVYLGAGPHIAPRRRGSGRAPVAHSATPRTSSYSKLPNCQLSPLAFSHPRLETYLLVPL